MVPADRTGKWIATNIQNENTLKEIVALQQELNQVKLHDAGLEQDVKNYKHSSFIIDKSPVILFRRLAAEKLKQRKMVYVSENISRFGYTADDFLSNRIMFRDIVHPDDTEKAPQVPGTKIFGRTISCDEIGGDYYDFIIRSGTSENKLSVVVGDISGHGVDSALLMTTARAFLCMRTSQPGSTTEIVSSMNRHLSEDVFDTGRFMTLFYLTLDLDRKSIEWVRAGHEPAWLYDPSEDRFEELKGPGLALGVEKDYEYRTSQRSHLKKGQVIIVGTDGMWEGHKKAGMMFGKQRLQELIRTHAFSSAETIVNAIFNEHRNFTQNAKKEDDITMVIIKFT